MTKREQGRIRRVNFFRVMKMAKLETMAFCGKCGIELHEAPWAPWYGLGGECHECGNNTSDQPYGAIELCANCLVPIEYAQGTAYCPECFARELRVAD
jgi:hypothetical protein